MGDLHLLFFASFLAHSELGQTEKYSARADVFRSSSNNGRWFGTTKRGKTDIPTLLSADILALRLHLHFADPSLWSSSREMFCEDFELYIWFVLLFQSGHFAVDGTVH